MDADDELAIEARCIRTLNRYAIAVGEHDHAGFAALFTVDGVWQRPGQEPLIGQDQIRAFIETALPKDMLVRHVNGSVRVDVLSKTGARAISYTSVYNMPEYHGGIASMPGPEYIVEYRDVLRREGADWLIARRDTFLIFRHDAASDLPGIPNPKRR